LPIWDASRWAMGELSSGRNQEKSVWKSTGQWRTLGSLQVAQLQSWSTVALENSVLSKLRDYETHRAKSRDQNIRSTTLVGNGNTFFREVSVLFPWTKLLAVHRCVPLVFESPLVSWITRWNSCRRKTWSSIGVCPLRLSRIFLLFHV